MGEERNLIWQRVWSIARAVGRVVVTGLRVLGATVKAGSGQANAPLLPPSADFLKPPGEYRP